MKILTVSDRVSTELVDDSTPAPIDKIDLILGCGDLPPEYLRTLRFRYDVPLFYILGNHDIRHDIPPDGCLNLTGRIVEHAGVNFLGFSGSRWYNGNQHQYREHQMRSQIRSLWFRLWRLKSLDVIMTHAPPRHVNDANDRCHKGFKCYNRFISRYQPQYFIHGHIHALFKRPEDRISIVGKTQVINSYGFHVFEI